MDIKRRSSSRQSSSMLSDSLEFKILATDINSSQYPVYAASFLAIEILEPKSALL